MIFLGLAMMFLAGWLSHWALESWRELHPAPPANVRQLARHARANRADLRRTRPLGPTPAALDHFDTEAPR